jgi:hypothetical protein
MGGWSNSNTSSGGGGSVDSVTGLNTNNLDPANPVVEISVDGVTITGAGTPASPLASSGGGTTINPTDDFIPVRSDATTFLDSFLENNNGIGGKVLKTMFGGNNIGFKIDFNNNAYSLIDNNKQKSLEWINRTLFSEYSTDFTPERALNYACTDIKTTSDYYQNDFLVSIDKQKAIINSAVNNQIIWYSGHTIEGVVAFPIFPPTLLGVVVALVGGTWERAKFTTGENGTNMLGIWLGHNKILLDGHCVVVTAGVTTNFPQCDSLTTTRIGSPIYGQPSIVGGSMTINEPISTGDIVKRLGHAYYEDTVDNLGYFIMLFRPSNDYTIAP